ncbi:MAG: hypothetical protein ACLPV8_02905, partial [Steroidobacteraceae bacterium]
DASVRWDTSGPPAKVHVSFLETSIEPSSQSPDPVLRSAPNTKYDGKDEMVPGMPPPIYM